MTFIFWHLLAICSVMAVAFAIGYHIGTIKEKNDKRSIN